MREPEAVIFERVEDQELDEFEPLRPGEPHVDWDDEEDYRMAEERFEALVDVLFAHLEDDGDLAVFEEVRDTLGWSEGEVIWEGMDFDQMFTDPGEFHAFELLSRRDQRAFIRERLRTQQASGTADATDGETDLDLDGKAPEEDPRRGPPTVPPKEQHPLVSYETETEHRPMDHDIGMTTGRDRRRGKR